MDNQSTTPASPVEALLAAQRLQWQHLQTKLEAEPIKSPALKNDIIYCECKVIEFDNELALLRR